MFNRAKVRREAFIENFRSGDKVARRWMIIYCGIAAFIIIGICAVILMNREYQSYEIISTIDKNDDVSVNYQVIGDGLIRYSKDGALFTDKNGNVLWNQTFEMSNAQVTSCDDYLAIGDIGSNQIRIFNQAGQIAVIDALYPVAALEISKQGVVAAILTDGQQNYVVMYDNVGTELVKIKATMMNTGYPVDLTLSEDGTKLAVSFLVIDSGDVSTRITFYKFGKTLQNDESNVMGSYDFAQIFPKIDFINNNTLVAFGEAGFEIYTMKDNVPEVVLEKLFEDQIKSIFYNEQYIGFVFKTNGDEDSSAAESETSSQISDKDALKAVQIAENDLNLVKMAVDSIAMEESDFAEAGAGVPAGSPHESESQPETEIDDYPSLNQSIAETAAGSSNSSGLHRYKMLVYTNTGKLYLDKEFDFDYHYIDCTNDEIVMYNENECLMIAYSGKEKFRHTFDSSISSLMPKQTKNEYILIDETTIKEIRLK